MKTFYHNTSRDIINETDLVEFMDLYEDEDLIYKTESGDAILIKIEGNELDDLIKEYSTHEIE